MAKTEVTIPLDIPDVRVLETELTKQGELVITIESIKPDARCRSCGQRITKFHGHDGWVTIRYLPVFGRVSYLRYRQKRYCCAQCDATTRQKVEWRDPNSPHATAYEDHLLLQLVNSTVQDVSLKEKVQDLQPEDRQVLRTLFTYSPKLKATYDFQWQLTDIIDQLISKTIAKGKIKAWINRVHKNGLTCFDEFIQTNDHWSEEITNFFVNRANSSFVEGFNNKIKVLNRRCYGLFNLKHILQRVFLDIEGYALFAT